MSTTREASRRDWRSQDNVADINAGSLQRIADATEAMSKDYLAMKRRAENFEEYYRSEIRRCSALQRSNAALRGVITRMRRKHESPTP